MDVKNIARAWRSSEFRESLSPEALANLPESPVGEIELNDDELNEALGGSIIDTIVESAIEVTIHVCASAAEGGTCDAFSWGCCA